MTEASTTSFNPTRSSRQSLLRPWLRNHVTEPSSPAHHLRSPSHRYSVRLSFDHSSSTSYTDTKSLAHPFSSNTDVALARTTPSFDLVHRRHTLPYTKADIPRQLQRQPSALPATASVCPSPALRSTCSTPDRRHTIDSLPRRLATGSKPYIRKQYIFFTASYLPDSAPNGLRLGPKPRNHGFRRALRDLPPYPPGCHP